MHAPVLVAEVISHLAPARGGLFVDCTLGAGGHTRALLEAGATRVLGFDRDRTRSALSPPRPLHDRLDRVELVHADYRSPRRRARRARHLTVVDGGILADLGVSSMQLDDAERGFSFRADAPLDMRMDRDSGLSGRRRCCRPSTSGARRRHLPVRRGALLAPHRPRHRPRPARPRPIETTGQLATIVRRAVPTRGWQRIDPATRTFQALRIWVNRELDGLDAFIRARRQPARSPARASRSSRSTRSRTASSSTRSGRWRRHPIR